MFCVCSITENHGKDIMIDDVKSKKLSCETASFNLLMMMLIGDEQRAATTYNRISTYRCKNLHDSSV